ncbi:MAG: dephospho-CoA kinase [Clostridia bacterium]|nr:dephospho-CoA kinase [Clostridia bacterium]
MKMLIGLTGRTGSGKSCAARIFEDLGAFVADCDSVAHEILFDNEIKKKLCQLFSDSILDSENNIDRKALGAIVFSDEKKLLLLNGVVHKAIVERCLSLCKESGKDICIMDGSELRSSGADLLCKHIVVIKADEKTRLERIMSRDNINREDALKRMNSQKDYDKEAIIIENNFGEDVLREKIRLLYNKFLGEINGQV